MGGYELGLETALDLAEGLAERLRGSQGWDAGQPVELLIAGRVSAEVRQRWDQRAAGGPIRWAGLVPREQIPVLDRSAHLLYSSDLNAACPNSVIEALACGLPVLSFDTGALSELVPPGAGRIVSYGGDPWRLDPPDIHALIGGAQEILAGGEAFRLAARARAEEMFGLDRMVSRYLKALQGTA
jgi:glycosyltransferase involved in cell wall biosynthesis